MRRKLTDLLPLAGIALILGGTQAARASIINSTVSYSSCYNTVNEGCTAAPAYVTGDGAGGTIHVIDFNDGTANDPNGVASYSAGWGINGASSPDGDSSNYLDINGNTVTITFSVAIDYFGFQWSSPDGYNSVHLYDGNTDLGGFNGSSVSGYYSFNAVGGTFNKVVLQSTSCCFETDNHAYVTAAANATPEPGTLTTAGMMLAVLPAYVLWRRRRARVTGR